MGSGRPGLVGWIGSSLIVASVMALGLGLPAAEPPAPPPAAIPVSSKAPVPPREASRQITVPKGFHVTLFAAEPDVVQPIAMTIDHRGRLWVVENYSYPDLAGRAARQGPHPDLRGRRRRRPVRSPDGLLRQGDQLHRHRAGLRRRLGLRHAQPALHPRPRRRRPARRPADRQARRLGHQGPAQHVQRPQLGPRRLALGLPRHPRAPRTSASRARRTRSGRR